MKFTLEIPDNSKAVSMNIIAVDKSGKGNLLTSNFDVTEADGKRIVISENEESVRMYDQ